MFVAGRGGCHVGDMNGIPRATLGLLIINVLVFAPGPFVPAWHNMVLEQGAVWFLQNPLFQPWQVVSYMFLHADLGHIFFNMFALVSFGAILEREWGAPRFLLFYFLCGVGAGLVQLGVYAYEFAGLHERLVAAGMTAPEIKALLLAGKGRLPTDPAVRAVLVELYGIFSRPMVGASGAIYGVLVAFGVLHPNAKLALMFVPVPVAAKYFIPVLLALDLLSGVTGFSLFGAGVAHFAHLGGAAIGFLLMLMWRKPQGFATRDLRPET